MYQPSQFDLPPQKPQRISFWTFFRSKHWLTQIFLTTCMSIFLCLALVGAISLAGYLPTSQSSSAQSLASQPASTGKPAQQTTTPSTQASHYPPKIQSDLLALSIAGDAKAVHPFRSESVGLTGVCPQPKIQVTVDKTLTGQTLAQNLLAYFYGQHLDNPCGSVIFAYHDQSEGEDVYTAGRVLFDATNAKGEKNLDPKATNLKYKLTLDLGDGVSGQQEYVVTY